MSKETQVLLNEWAGVLDDTTCGEIKDSHRRAVTAQLLENQKNDNQKQLNEAAQTGVANITNYDPVLISMVRRAAPKLIAYDICGVQAMQLPTGLVFAMKARYTNKTGDEALFNKVNTAFSGSGDHSDTANPFLASSYPGAVKTGTGSVTATAEDSRWPQMSATVESVQVVAKTRHVRSDYTQEVAQDWQNVHGMNAETELANILASEIILEQNQEVVRTIYQAAEVGAQFGTTAGTIDLLADTDGRWSAERFKGLLFAIERDANAIAYATCRGKGNILITSSNVASALQIAGLLDYAPAIQAMSQNLEVDVTGTTYAGNMGRFRVFIDPFLSHDGYVVGYKGNSAIDAGLFYCPYVALQLTRATDSETLNPIIGFKTRYGMVANPFTSLDASKNIYYRKVAVTGF